MPTECTWACCLDGNYTVGGGGGILNEGIITKGDDGYYALIISLALGLPLLFMMMGYGFAVLLGLIVPPVVPPPILVHKT